nr:MAG: ASCH domain protein [Bacteriophage sp.]
MKKIMFNDRFGLTQAVLEGRKTMTRRIVTYPLKFRGVNVAGYFVCKRPSGEVTEICMYDEDERMIDGGQILPKYKVGEVVAIAQSYKDLGYDPDSLDRDPKDLGIRGFMKHSAGWNNKMFVSAAACKKHIRITGVKCERLQDISEADCLKEGIIKYTKDGTVFKYDLSDRFEMFSWQDMKRSPREAFSALIDKVSGKGAWECNPFVWAYEFELID